MDGRGRTAGENSFPAEHPRGWITLGNSTANTRAMHTILSFFSPISTKEINRGNLGKGAYAGKAGNLDFQAERPWEGPVGLSHTSVPPKLGAREGGGNPFVLWPRGRNGCVGLYPISQLVVHS
jgi:hypothetical protein